LIYIDSSVALAHLLGEPQRPDETFWLESLVSSRLLEFEVINVLRTKGRGQTHEGLANDLLAGVGLVELIPEVIGLTKGKMSAVRTLDALHLASAVFLMGNGVNLRLASYDARMVDAARKLRIPIYPL
jgi:predicted nucleic acid-binding protein